MDLANSWLDAGWLEEFGGPFDSWLDYVAGDWKSREQQLEQLKTYQEQFGQKFNTPIGQLYSVNDKYCNTYGFSKPRWNFECPTHKPVPTVAILLGNYFKH